MNLVLIELNYVKIINVPGKDIVYSQKKKTEIMTAYTISVIGGNSGGRNNESRYF